MNTLPGKEGQAAAPRAGLFCRSFPELVEGKAWRRGSLCCSHIPSAFISAPEGCANMGGQRSGLGH